jgi:hypothetical protein
MSTKYVIQDKATGCFKGARVGCGQAVWTHDLSRARTFTNAGAAMASVKNYPDWLGPKAEDDMDLVARKVTITLEDT